MAPRRRHSVARDIADAFAEHNLLAYAAAIAFQGFVAGAMLVVGSWIVVSLIFRVWITGVANFKTRVGSLAGLFVRTGYLFVSSIVFLVGVQLDELLRKETGGRARGVVGLVRGR